MNRVTLLAAGMILVTTASAATPRERARLMLTGLGVEVDPGFAYYHGRSAASIAGASLGALPACAHAPDRARAALLQPVVRESLARRGVSGRGASG